MSTTYRAGSRRLQDRFDTRRLADRLEEKFVSRSTIGADDLAFIERMDMFFLATADAEGRPQCSYKGGEPGFVRVLDERTLAFPSYDGNGMYLSMGNVLENPHVGMLFIDFTAARPSRLRVNGIASIDESDDLIASYPGAQLVVRVRATQVFPNCPRYIHRMALIERSRFVPQADTEAPIPDWKRAEWACDVLPADDPPPPGRARGRAGLPPFGRRGAPRRRRRRGVARGPRAVGRARPVAGVGGRRFTWARPPCLALLSRARPASRRRRRLFTGRLGGRPRRRGSAPLDWRRGAELEIDHTPGRGWSSTRQGGGSRRSAGPDQEPVTCVIPGHHRQGRELFSDLVDVNAGRWCSRSKGAAPMRPRSTTPRRTDRASHQPATITSSWRGPCTPSTRSSSMSEVADGPEIRVRGRRPFRTERPSVSIASGTPNTICSARTTQMCTSGTNVTARRP